MELEDIARRITPSEGELKSVERVAGRLISEISNRGYKVIWVGSSARNTFVKGERDIDVFVVFPPDSSAQEMQRELFSIARDVLGGYEKKYAQHPYAHALREGFDVDLVPCHPYGKGKLTPVDRTPEHHRYVSSRLNDETREEIRLLKQFLKGCGLYGAESSVHGFSGYLCELLILHYGSFEKTLGEGARWRHGTTIGIKDATRMEGPLVLIDPVDPERNVAAALSRNSFALFIQSARRYLESPSERFFFPEEKEKTNSGEEFARRGTEILYVHFPKPDLVDEILYPQVEKLEDGLRRALEMDGFRIFRSLIEIDEEVEVLIEHTCLKSEVEKHLGPYLWDFENSERFWDIHKNKNPYIENGRWYVDLYKSKDAPTLIEEKFDKIAMGKNLKRIGEEMRVELFDPGSNEELLTKLLHPPHPWDP